MKRRIIPTMLIVVLLAGGSGFCLNSPTPPAVFFELGSQDFGSLGTVQIGLADLDGDDDPDAVFSNYQYYATTVYFNDGDGIFTSTGQTLPPANGHGVGLSDFDGDGDIDLFLTYASFEWGSKIYFNDGSGYFTETGQDLGDASISGNAVYVFDIDGDNDDDVLIDYYLEDNIVYENNGAGVFADNGQIYPENSCFADLDADSDIDILQCDEAGPGYRTWINDGSGNFTVLSYLADPSLVRGHADFGDLDNDGDIDAVVTNGTIAEAHATKILYNDGTGVFSESGLVLADAYEGRACIGDLNADGNEDIILTSYHEPHQLYVNDGEGGFSWSEFGGDPGVLTVFPVLADLDHDGLTDLVVPNFESGASEIWFNVSDLTDCCTVMGDFDHNGRTDTEDIVAWVHWAFHSSPIAPACENPPGFWPECDMDGTSQVDVADLVYWTTWSFRSGPDPVPCP